MINVKKDSERKPEPEDREVYDDSMGPTPFLPLKRCRTCED